ncbi:MAG: 16S rRNA (uracil(1498)-N(3))-methyltransferase [Candidatus Adiutrix sp.]|nr:16S rRNA (uracil(1498)-N(3))-methyltransferase [Candidatus Adiutrix sp.]
MSWPLRADPETLEEVFLETDQARHGALVLRLGPGAELEMTGPAGLAPARVSTVGGQGGRPRLGVIRCGPWRRVATLPGPRLALALISARRFDWAVEKAAELGASTLYPLLTERGKSGGAQPGAVREGRWPRLAEEARKQCGRPDRLEIGPALGFEELLALPGPGFFLSPAGGSQGPAVPDPPPLLAVGPEGGFSPGEEEALLKAGFTAWRLGPALLRSETAALAALAVLLGRRT